MESEKQVRGVDFTSVKMLGSQLQLDVPSYYTNIETFSMGAFGIVSSALDTRTGEKVALKKLSRPFATATHAQQTYREIVLLKHLRNHSNIICLKDIFTPAQTVDDLKEVYLVMDLMPTDLCKVLKVQRLADEHVMFFIYQILRGLKFLHGAGIVHRDLKPANIGVNPECELKLLDFGSARRVGNDMTGYVVTRWWRAPEVLLSWNHYNEKVDVWSAGCIMAEMMSGEPLIKGNNYLEQLQASLRLVGTPSDELLTRWGSPEATEYIKRLPLSTKQDFSALFKGRPALAIDLLDKMLELDPDLRISVDQALEHPFLEPYHDPSDEPVAPPLDQSFVEAELDLQTWKGF